MELWVNHALSLQFEKTSPYCLCKGLAMRLSLSMNNITTRYGCKQFGIFVSENYICIYSFVIYRFHMETAIAGRRVFDVIQETAYHRQARYIIAVSDYLSPVQNFKLKTLTKSFFHIFLFTDLSYAFSTKKNKKQNHLEFSV